ncbi:sulfhydryl oxidase 2-like [Macrosteles quadrilineatus]|uniref:sulfhydryl oxidase 2-like n=1 Tax=Macrosteles quadrilineatus TaxID=74068 RepID=UPI0023E13692|nr:sulfhydryl oxidase 2-like [Macrosteles quadrilineatus]
MVVLNSTNFNQVVYQEQKDKLWLVEFYNHWCGYCIRFVAVMKAFATEVYDWRDVVKVGAIDCANSMNNQICRNHEIKRVPSIKIFPPHSEENFVGLEFGKGSETTVSEMREKLAQILKSYHNSQKEISGPVNLELFKHYEIEKLRSEMMPPVTYLMLVFEPKDSLVGAQVALDVSKTPEIRVRLVHPRNTNLTHLVGMEEGKSGAVILQRHYQLSTHSHSNFSEGLLVENNDIPKEDLNVSVLEEEIKLSSQADQANDINQITNISQFEFIPLETKNFTRDGLNNAVRKFLREHGVDIAAELPKTPIIHTNVSVDEIKEAMRREEALKRELNVKHLSSVVFQMDIESALEYALKGEITLKQNITASQLEALRDFMSAVIKYFPFQGQGKQFFKELKEIELDNKDSVCGEDFLRTFKKLEEKYRPFMPNLEWVGCRGTIPTLRGYPCSLWTLFHTLVVQEDLQESNSTKLQSEALNAMTGYIRNFFSCSPCAEHFNQMAKTIDGNVTSQRDAVMWLWKAHNNVNLRLAGDETEDPRHHKVQFPTKDACPSCYSQDGSWDETEVFTFLSNMFTNIVLFNPHDLPYYVSTTSIPTL